MPSKIIIYKIIRDMKIENYMVKCKSLEERRDLVYLFNKNGFPLHPSTIRDIDSQEDFTTWPNVGVDTDWGDTTKRVILTNRHCLTEIITY